MLSVGEGEEAYFDTTDYLMLEDSVAANESSEYGIWLREPHSVVERRENFLFKMGFSECPISVKTEEAEIERADELSGGIDDSLLSERRKSNSEANCSGDYSSHDWLDDMSLAMEEEMVERLASDEQREMMHFEASIRESVHINTAKKHVMSWWRSFSRKLKKNHAPDRSKDSKLVPMRIEQNQKRCMECTAVYAGQVIKAHDGLIRTMKFSPDGQYLASGGEDGVVCIWQLTTVHASNKAESTFRLDKSSHASIVIPDEMLHIEEEPLQRLKGHRGDVLDLDWSSSNHLLSSSTDETVRLWRADSDKCLAVFHHSNYVTCVQFNPVDESHFISGCIDGKVRIWGISSERVEEWGDVQDVVTAVSYQPNGKGFITGSLSGNCHFYKSSGNELILNAEINIRGRKKSSCNRITGIQFVNNDSQRVMITSEDSKIRILDGLEVVQKYKGLKKSGSQMSASFTSTGKHIVSIGDDSRVYLWNYNCPSIQTSKQAKSTRSCESFVSEGASVVLNWSGSVSSFTSTGRHIVSIGDDSRVYLWNYDCPSIQTSKQAKSTRSCESFVSEGASVVLNWSGSVKGDKSFACASPTGVLDLSPWIRESEGFSLANWFSMDISLRGNATWPEEKLSLSVTDHDSCRVHFHQQQRESNSCSSRIASTAWGLVFLTGNHDGTIRTFHNYGLPLRV